MVTLSITSCKRLHLFEKTVKCSYDNCEDNSSTSHVYYFDDSSSDEDRLKMETILRFLFPPAHLHNYRFSSESFPGKKRAMIEWLNAMKSENFFNFNLEYDWLFDSKFSLSELRKFLETKGEVISFVRGERRTIKMGNDVNGFVILEKDLKKYL